MPRDLVIDHLEASSWSCLQSEEYTKYRSDNQNPSTPSNNYRIIYKNAEDYLEETNESFDAIFSIAAFEHFLKLPQAIANVGRVLRPGGTLFSIFAPIWSGPWGNHWTGAVPLRFNERLPKGWSWTSHTIFNSPWDHLLLGPTEFFDYYAKRFDRQFAEALTYETFQSPQINRLFYEDYEYIFQKNGLESLIFQGLFNIDYSSSDIYKSLVERLTTKHALNKYRNFVSSGIIVYQRKAL